MVTIDGTNIKLTRGNTFDGQVAIKQGTQTYTPAPGDTVRFVMRNVYQDEEPVISKELNNLALHLAPEDTAELPCRMYLYNINLEQAGGNEHTFIVGFFELIQEA